MNIVHQPRTLLVRGLNAGMGTAAGADELVEIPRPLHLQGHLAHKSPPLPPRTLKGYLTVLVGGCIFL